MIYEPLLEKQLETLLPKAYLEDENIRLFLAAVSETYGYYEHHKKLHEDSLLTSERRYLEIKEQIETAKNLEVELTEAKLYAENDANAKSDFLSVMSHEIRTPLNAIIGNVHLLQQEDPMPSQEEYLRVLQISSENLLSLINDILDFGKIEEGRIVFSARDIDIREFIYNLQAANKMRAEERGNKLTVCIDEKIPVFVRGDEVRLNQVLNNLITNAIKFTLNGHIRITMQLREVLDEELSIWFEVADDGIGIEKEKQELIFERFTQANSDITRQFGGSGLGLTIVKRLLQLQCSDIKVESEAGIGSRFSFVLSFSISDTLERPEKKLDFKLHDLQGAKILLVEDVEFNIRIAEKMLQNWKAVVDVAENGQIAIEKARANNYQLILMDLQMPVMDGYRASAAIRRTSRNVPIVALTASVSSDITEKVYEAGMNGYLSKPFNPEDLYRTVYKHVMA
ncbi:MAG: response regulator [Chitinophagaceae bacterium]|nr:response regulator [Chitinophagaceae bacterium]